ncbi:unnamed protein product [Tenebrio molitor]|nr:unnamed protein product [Tenebrio molitor]
MSSRSTPTLRPRPSRPQVSSGETQRRRRSVSETRATTSLATWESKYKEAHATLKEEKASLMSVLKKMEVNFNTNNNELKQLRKDITTNNNEVKQLIIKILLDK